jgi:hypothetical protein
MAHVPKFKNYQQSTCDFPKKTNLAVYLINKTAEIPTSKNKEIHNYIIFT